MQCGPDRATWASCGFRLQKQDLRSFFLPKMCGPRDVFFLFKFGSISSLDHTDIDERTKQIREEFLK